MKKAKRLLALVVAFVMLVSGASVSSYAYWADYTTPSMTDNYNYYMTPEQGASWLLDMVDELLAGEEIYIDIDDTTGGIVNGAIDLRSYNALVTSLPDVVNSNSTLLSLLGFAVGMIADLEVSSLEGAPMREDTYTSDLYCLYTVTGFLNQNKNLLGTVIESGLDLGLVGSFLDLPSMINNLPGFLKATVYGLLTGDTSYADNEDFGSVPSIDSALQNLVNAAVVTGTDPDDDSLLGPNFAPLMPSLTVEDVNLQSATLYDLVNKALTGLLESMLGPMLYEVLMDAFGIEITEEYPKGDPAELNNETLVMVCGMVTDLCGQFVQGTEMELPDYSDCLYPGEKVEELLNWFLVDGGMDVFIRIDESGIAITDDFMALLSDLARLAIPLAVNMELFPAVQGMPSTDELTAKDEATGEYIMPDIEVYGWILKIVLSDLINGAYIPAYATDIYQVGAYAMASIAADIIPQYNFYDALDANYTDQAAVDTNGIVVEKLPFKNEDGLPVAFLEIVTQIGVFYLNGMIDYTEVGYQIPEGCSFEEFVDYLINWVFTTYTPILKDTAMANLAAMKDANGNSLNLTWTNSTIWQKLDASLFKMIPADWMPAGIDGSYDLVVKWLLGNVFEFDLQGIVSLFSVREGGELDTTGVIPLLLRIVDRVLKLVFGGNALLPQSTTTDFSGATVTSVTSLDGLLSAGTLKTLIVNLLTHLHGYRYEIFETLLPLLANSEYDKPYRTDKITDAEALQISPEELSDYVEYFERLNTYVVGTETDEETGEEYDVYESLDNFDYKTFAKFTAGTTANNGTVSFEEDAYVFNRVEDYGEKLYHYLNQEDQIETAKEVADGAVSAIESIGDNVLPIVKYYYDLVEYEANYLTWTTNGFDGNNDKTVSKTAEDKPSKPSAPDMVVYLPNEGTTEVNRLGALAFCSAYVDYASDPEVLAASIENDAEALTELGWSSTVDSWQDNTYTVSDYYMVNQSFIDLILEMLSDTQTTFIISTKTGEDWLGRDEYSDISYPMYEESDTTKMQTAMEAWITYCEDQQQALANAYDQLSWRTELSQTNRSTTLYANQLQRTMNMVNEAYNGGNNYVVTGYDPVTGAEITEKSYTTASYEPFKKMFEYSQDLCDLMYSNPSQLTQSMFTLARRALWVAYLDLAGYLGNADYTQLNIYISQANDILANLPEGDLGYTPETVEILRNALADGVDISDGLYVIEGVETDIDSERQKLVDDIAGTLYAAMNGLEYILAPDIVANVVDEVAKCVLDTATAFKFVHGILRPSGFEQSDVAPIGGAELTINETERGFGTGTNILGFRSGLLAFRYFVVVYGDINGDAIVDGTDMTLVQAYSVLGPTASGVSANYKVEAADVNHDGTIDALDVEQIQGVYNYARTIEQTDNTQADYGYIAA